MLKYILPLIICVNFAFYGTVVAHTKDIVTKETVLNEKFVYLNDIIELKCKFYSLKNSSNLFESNNSIANTSLENNFHLGIFKKDNVLIQLNKSVLKLLILNAHDAGNYECGSYRIDKYGQMNYVILNSWNIKILGKLNYYLELN